MDDTKLPEVIKPKQIKRSISPRNLRQSIDNKPLTPKQMEIFTLFEEGKSQTEIAQTLGKSNSYISDTLRDFSKRYKINKEYIKLNGVNILNSKLKEKQNNPSNKDVVDIVLSLNELTEPKKGSDINLIDKQMTINLSNDLDNLSSEEKLERLRRALSE